MTEIRKQIALGLVISVSLVLGLVFDRLSDPVEVNTAAPTAHAAFEASAAYCPPPVATEGSATSALAPARPGAPVGAGLPEERVDVSDGSARRAVDRAEAVTAYGSPLGAGSLQTVGGDVTGVVASSCAQVASDRWYFAQGSSALRVEQRFVIHNPLRHEAVVAITLYTPKREIAPANLTQVAVPAQQTTVVRLNRYLEQQDDVAAAIVAERGRVVAWRTLATGAPDLPDGVTMSLGSPELAERWFLPFGGVGGGTDERIGVLNPTDDEAVVNVTLVTRSRGVQPPKLVKLVLPPRRLRMISLNKAVTGSQEGLTAAAAVVSTTSGSVAVERETFSIESMNGVESETGIPETAAHWLVPPAAARAATDLLVLVNPGREKARVRIRSIPGGGPDRTVVLKPTSHVRVDVAGYGFLDVTSQGGEIVAERVAAASDIASVAGTPVDD